ncbi:MAG: formylglycine-generating enzyme family protein [Planctomycetota bacterium]
MDPEAEARAALDAGAAKFHRQVMSSYQAGKYEQVLRDIDAAGGKYDKTGLSDDLASLRMEALSKLRETEERALEREAADFLKRLLGLMKAQDYDGVVREADDKRDRYQGTSVWREIERLRTDAAKWKQRYVHLSRQARGAFADGNLYSASNLLQQARSLRKTKELDDLTAKIRRGTLLQEARKKEKKGSLAGAIELYKEALGLADDEGVRRRIQELERKMKLAKLVADGDRLLGKRRWKDAVERCREALAIATADEKPPIQKKIESVEREMRYLEHTAQARRAIRAKAWEEAKLHLLRALAIKPGDGNVLDLLALLPPPREVTNSIGMRFVLVPAGEFTMGSEDGDQDEEPVRRAHLDAFYIGRYEVTNTQYERYIRGHRKKWLEYSPGNDTPAVAVTWEEATAFCDWLSQQEKDVEYRLPTEAEWERAARGTDGRTYPWGNDGPKVGEAHRCNYAPAKGRESWKGDGFEVTAPVGKYPAGVSPHGCYDMAGNVWEWCRDWYAPCDTRREAGAPSEGTKKVLRGGSFSNGHRTVRSANRAAKPPNHYAVNIGFRVVRAVRKRGSAALETGSKK